MIFTITNIDKPFLISIIRNNPDSFVKCENCNRIVTNAAVICAFCKSYRLEELDPALVNSLKEDSEHIHYDFFLK